MPEQLMDDIEVKHVSYPQGGGITELGIQLREIIEKLDEVPNQRPRKEMGSPADISPSKNTGGSRSLPLGLILDRNTGFIVSLMYKDSRASYGPFRREDEARLWIENSVDVHANGDDYARQVYALYSPESDYHKLQNIGAARTQGKTWVLMVDDEICVGPFRERDQARQWMKNRLETSTVGGHESKIFSVSWRSKK